MPLLATRRQRLTSGLVAVFALAWSGQAIAQDRPQGVAECPRRANGSVSMNATDVITLAQSTIRREIATTAAQEVSNSELESARNICRGTGNNAIRTNSRNYQAQMCIGDASMLLAERTRLEADYQQAYCAYSNAAGIAGTRPSVARADALEKTARTFESWRDLSASGSERYAQFNRGAAQHLANAVTADGNSTSQDAQRRRLAAGRAYLRIGDTQRAQSYITAGGTGLPVALGLVEIANGLQGDAKTNMLRQAYDAARNSFSVNVALGTAYINAKNWGEASARLNDANRILGNAMENPEAAQLGPNPPNYRAQLYSGLAVLDARNSSWGSVLSNAQRARDAGGADTSTRRLLCAGLIGRGGWERNSPATGDCSLDGPQGQLLLGMYHLRRAQYFHGPGIMYPGAQRENHTREIQAAIAAFDRGESAIPTGQPAPKLDWPELDRETDVAEMLRYGRSVVAYLCSPGTPDLPRGDANVEAFRARGEAFYRRYNVWNCAA